VAEFARRFAPNLPVGYSNRDPVNNYLQISPFMRNYVPNMVFIDRKWTIRAQYAGDDPFFKNELANARGVIETLLKESAGGSTKKSSSKKKK
jgi:hypothetical protein